MSKLKVMSFKGGSYIAIEGQRLSYFYIIQSGSVQIFDKGSDRPKLLVAGDFFGLEACLTKTMFASEAYASDPVVVFCVRAEEMQQLFSSFPSIGMKIMHFFSTSLREIEAMDQEVVAAETQGSDVAGKGNVSSTIRVLLDTGIYFFNDKSMLNNAYQAYTVLKNEYKDELSEDILEIVEQRLATLTERGAVPFDKFPDNEITQINRNHNELIITEGEMGDHLFVVVSGEVEIFKIVGKKKIMIAKLEAGSMFGEMALIEDKPRSASAMSTKANTQLTIVPRNQFATLIMQQPALGYRLAVVFAERMHSTRGRLRNRLFTDPVLKIYDMLVLELEKLKVNLEQDAPYLLNFTRSELCSMVGMEEKEYNRAVQKITREDVISFNESNITIANLFSLKKIYSQHSKEVELKRTLNEKRKI